MSIANNPNDVLLGTGRIYVNNTYVGAISDSVKKTRSKEFKDIMSGTDLIVSVKTSDTTTFELNLLEFNADILATLMPDLAITTESAGTETVVDDYVENLSSLKKSALSHSKLTSAAVTVSLSSALSASASAGSLYVYVDSVDGFTAGDSVLLRNGSTTESHVIATSGVDTGTNKLTFTVALTSAFPADSLAVNTTVTLAEGTDYYLDRLYGTVYLITASTKLASGNCVAVDYTYTTYNGRGFTWGGATDTSSPVQIDFWHKRRDGKYVNLRLWKCTVTSDFELEFPEDSEMSIPLTVTAAADTTKNAGEQIGRIFVYEATAAPDGGW